MDRCSHSGPGESVDRWSGGHECVPHDFEEALNLQSAGRNALESVLFATNTSRHARAPTRAAPPETHASKPSARAHRGPRCRCSTGSPSSVTAVAGRHGRRAAGGAGEFSAAAAARLFVGSSSGPVSGREADAIHGRGVGGNGMQDGKACSRHAADAGRVVRLLAALDNKPPRAAPGLLARDHGHGAASSRLLVPGVAHSGHRDQPCREYLRSQPAAPLGCVCFLYAAPRSPPPTAKGPTQPRRSHSFGPCGRGGDTAQSPRGLRAVVGSAPEGERRSRS